MIARKFKPGEMLDLLEHHEGYRQFMYLDTEGNRTIGLGTNLENGITRGQARGLAWDHCLLVLPEIERNIPFWHDLSKKRQMVLVSMVYNLKGGIAGLLKFKRALAAMKAEDWNTAAKEMLDSRWAKQVGNRAEELADMMRMG